MDLSKAFDTINYDLLLTKLHAYFYSQIKHMITSTQITNPEIFAFIAVLVFKLLTHKVLFINRKDNRNC